MNKEELLQQIRDTRNQFEATLSRIPEEQMTEPLLPNGWSVKDLIGHIGFWETRTIDYFDILEEGYIPQLTYTTIEIDELNAQAYMENQDRTLEDVRRWERDAYDELLFIVEDTAEEELFDPHRFQWTRGQTTLEGWVVDNTYGHYDDHLPDLLALLETNH